MPNALPSPLLRSITSGVRSMRRSARSVIVWVATERVAPGAVHTYSGVVKGSAGGWHHRRYRDVHLEKKDSWAGAHCHSAKLHMQGAEQTAQSLGLWSLQVL